MRPNIKYLTIVLILFLLQGCEMEEMHQIQSNYCLEIHIDTTGTKGVYNNDVWKTSIYDITNGQCVYETFYERDKSDKELTMKVPLKGLSFGTYNILSYNYSTNKTIVTNEQKWNDVFARTEIIGQSGKTDVILCPDHLLKGTTEHCELPVLTETDKEYIINMDCCTIVEDWAVEISGISNLQYAQRVSVFINGQKPGKKITTNKDISEQCMIAFDADIREVIRAESKQTVIDTLAYKKFRTFGNIPDCSKILILYVLGRDGTEHYDQINITEQMKESSETRTVQVKTNIKLNPVSGGGIEPQMQDWNIIKKIIEIGNKS